MEALSSSLHRLKGTFFVTAQKFALPVSVGLIVPAVVLAQTPTEALSGGGPAIASLGLVLAFVGAGMSTFLSCLGSIIGVSMTGQAGAGLLTDKPQLTGKVITLTVLPGSQGLYGMVISLLFIFNYGPIISEQMSLTTMEGLSLFTAFLPVAITCLTSAPYQAKVCAAGMRMLAKDDKLTGSVITLAALVETYALLGFLISFFMLNAFKAAIIG